MIIQAKKTTVKWKNVERPAFARIHHTKLWLSRKILVSSASNSNSKIHHYSHDYTRKKTLKWKKVERTSYFIIHHSKLWLFRKILVSSASNGNSKIHHYSHDYRSQKIVKRKKVERTSQLLLLFIILSYDYSGKYLFHLHQTVIPKYIIIVMIIEAKMIVKSKKVERTSNSSNSSF